MTVTVEKTKSIASKKGELFKYMFYHLTGDPYVHVAWRSAVAFQVNFLSLLNYHEETISFGDTGYLCKLLIS